jgi:hypothetical protein
VIFILIRFVNKGMLLKNQFIQNKLLLGELLIVAIGAGLLPSFVMEFSSENALYFTDLTFWLAAVIFISFSSMFSIKTFPVSKNWLGKLIVIAVIGYFVHSYYNSWKRTGNYSLVLNNLLTRKLIMQERDTSKIVFKKELSAYLKSSKKRSDIDRLFSNSVGDTAAKNDFYKSLWLLKSLDTIPLSKKAQSLIYVDNQEFPEMHPFSCYQLPLLIPALTGIAAVYGTPVEGCIKEGYGFEYYTLRSIDAPGEQEASKRVSELGFKYLYYFSPSTKKFYEVSGR